MSVRFFFFNRGSTFFLCNFCLGVFGCVLILIPDEYGIGLNIFFLINPLHNGYFGNQDTMENILNCLSV